MILELVIVPATAKVCLAAPGCYDEGLELSRRARTATLPPEFEAYRFAFANRQLPNVIQLV